MRRCQVVNPGLVEYGKAWEMQKDLFHARSLNAIIDTFLIMQHPPTYTFGRRSQTGLSILSEEKIPLNPPLIKGEIKFPPFRKGGMGGFDRSLSGEDIKQADIYWVDRGGGATYHGTGQIVGYPIIWLRDYTSDLHEYLRMLEEVIIRALKDFQIDSERVNGYTGVWVQGQKIGSIGVRVIRGVTMHGFSLNVNNDLAPFDKIVPCNIQGVRMTSMLKILGTDLIVSEVEEGVTDHFARVFDVNMECVSNPLQTCLV